MTNEYPPEKTAGTALSTRFFAEELASRGCRVTVVVNTRLTAPAREIDGEVEVIRLRPLIVPKTRMAQRAVLVWNVARRVRPDIIQGQSLSCGFLALVVGKCLGIPAVAYIQGLDLYHSGAWARRTYIRWTLAYSARVAAVTSDLQSIALSLSGRRAEVIPHGFRTHDAHTLDQQAARALLGLPQQNRLVLYVGRLIPIKGVAHLVRAMPYVLRRSPDARLVVVGDGEERQSLVGLTRTLGLEACVSFVGERPHEDVIKFMRAADLFVLPSLVESFGIVLVEAMSCGLPVVASNVMGIPSVVEDAVNGFLVPPGDEVALGERITALLTERGARMAMAAQNHEKAKGYAWRCIADRFVQLWEGAVALRCAGGAPRAPLSGHGLV